MTFSYSLSLQARNSSEVSSVSFVSRICSMKNKASSFLFGVGICFLLVTQAPAQEPTDLLQADMLKQKSGFPSFYTGELLPKPQQVLSKWSFIPLGHADLEITLATPSSETMLLAQRLIREKISDSATGIAKTATGKVSLYIGPLQSPLIQRVAQERKLGLAKIKLKPEGYVIRTVRDKQGTIIIAAGADVRGTFYGAMTIRQQIGVEAGQLGIRLADINDWPEWAQRFASDYSPISSQALQFLGMNKINGYAIQHRREWHDFDADTVQDWGRQSTYGKELQAMKEFRDRTGLIDFMLVINIYADRKQSWFDITNEQDIAGLVERCKYAAQMGITHVMICVDDWTPSEGGRYVCPNPTEKVRFGDSVGKAQGYLMARLYQALKTPCPDLALSLCSPVYSLKDHKAESKHGADYLRDLSNALPPEVAIAWSGPRVVNKENSSITQDDFKRYSKLVNGHKLIYWDNGEGTNPPIPHWNVKFYDGFATDSQGVAFLNMHTLGWAWSLPFTLNAHDYLWNPKGFNENDSFKHSVEQIYGRNTFKPVNAFVQKFGALQALSLKRELYRKELMEKQTLRKAKTNPAKTMSTPAADAVDGEWEARKAADRKEGTQLIGELEALLSEFKRLNLPTEQPASAVGVLKAEAELQVPELSIGRVHAAPTIDGVIGKDEWAQATTVTLTPMKEGSEPVTVQVGYDDGSLYLAFQSSYQKELAIPVFKDKHDDAVYSSPDAIEIFLQPGFGGSYGHLVFDHMGNTFDERNNGEVRDWNPAWTIKVQKSPGSWSAEIALPFSSLQDMMGTPPIPGTVWRGNFARVYNAENQISTWSPTHGASFHNETFWGKLKFAD
jgi:hypothetical protein